MAHYVVLTSQVDSISRKIRTISKKCEKANVPFTFTVGKPYDHPIEFVDPRYIGKGINPVHLISFTDIDIDCHFSYNGWHVLGFVQRKDGVLQCYFDTPDLIRQYKDTDFHCDHCHKNIYRNSVAILENESTHERKVVGTSCVKEFTCGLDGNLIAGVADVSELIAQSAVFIQIDGMTVRDFNDIDEEWYSERNAICGAKRGYEVNKVVSCAASLIREDGFHSSMSYNATWKFIHEVLDRYDDMVTEEDKSEAQKAVDWILGMSEDEYTQSSYLFNLYQICSGEYCSELHFSFLASLIPSYRKTVSQKIESEQKRESSYVGEVGDRITLPVTILKRICFDSVYGTCRIILMADCNGNILKWKTSKYVSNEEGSKTVVTATVKEHELYSGEKQTAITRCKFSS